MNSLVKSRKKFNEQSKHCKPLCIVSDFHGVYEAMDFVRDKINRDNERVAILGDCMDRGTQGMRILSEIKAMEESGKDIMYLPGNHDDMLYLRYKNVIDNYRQFKNVNMANDDMLEDFGEVIYNIARSSKYEPCAKSNGQIRTFEEIEKMCKTIDGTKEFLELMLWLEKQPILRIEVDCNGRKIAMGHAAFDMDVYNKKETYNLKDKAEDDKVYENLRTNAPDSQEYSDIRTKISKIYTCLWYRNPNENGNYNFNNVVKLPDMSEADIIVVGHSPRQMEVEIIGENITRTAVDVDGGIVECYMLGRNAILKFEPHKDIVPTEEFIESLKINERTAFSTMLKISDLLPSNDTEKQDDVKIWKSDKSEEEEEEATVKIWIPKSKRNAEPVGDGNNNQGEDFGDI